MDADLAELYGVTTKRLNEQVRRNRSRFPEDFIFQLTTEEKSASLCLYGTWSNYGRQALKSSP